MGKARLTIPSDEIGEFCRRHHITRLSVFGSALRDDFGPKSDVDFLVEFEPGHTPGLIKLAALERELEGFLGGRTADIRTLEDLSRYFRDEVAASAEVQYAAR